MTSTLICIPNTKGNHFPLDSDYLYLYLVDMQAMHFSLLDSIMIELRLPMFW